MTNNEAIRFHLTNYYNESNGLTFFSGFCGALKDARKMTGRNIETGHKDNSNEFGHLGSWLGTIGYLSLLDQIGGCFKKIGEPIIDSKKSGIIKALKYFSDLNDDKINAIYALRNSFAHDYSLQNVNSRQVLLTHHFVVENSETNPTVSLPTNNWDGLMENKSSQNATHINLQSLGDLVEGLVNRLIELNEQNQIEIILAGGKEELISRYSFVTGRKIL